MRTLPKPQTAQLIDNLQPSPHFTPLHLPLLPIAPLGLEGVALAPPQGWGARKATLVSSLHPLSPSFSQFLGCLVSSSLPTPINPLEFLAFCLVSAAWQAEGPEQEKRPISCRQLSRKRKALNRAGGVGSPPTQLLVFE